jgi:hypothetical protein
MSEPARLARPLLAASLDRGVAALRWSGFWCAVLLPFVHVPLLIAGFDASSSPVPWLWAANLLALVVGRRHTPHGRSTDRRDERG